MVTRNQPRARHEGAWIELDLIRQEARVAHERLEVGLVLPRRRAQKVDHEVRMNLEPKEPYEREGPLHLGDRCCAMVCVQDLLTRGLDSNLYLGAAKAPEKREALWRDGIGTRLDDQSNDAMRGRLVSRLLCRELLFGRLHNALCLPEALALLAPRVFVRRNLTIQPRKPLVVGLEPRVDKTLLWRHESRDLLRVVADAEVAVMGLPQGKNILGDGPVVEGMKELANEPELVAARIVAPRASEHDELDLVHGVSHLVQGRKARHNLQVWIEEVLLGTLAGGFVGEVALRHAQVVGTIHAVAGTRLRTSEHRNRSHARRRATRLHAKRAQ